MNNLRATGQTAHQRGDSTHQRGVSSGEAVTTLQRGESSGEAVTTLLRGESLEQRSAAPSQRASKAATFTITHTPCNHTWTSQSKVLAKHQVHPKV